MLPRLSLPIVFLLVLMLLPCSGAVMDLHDYNDLPYSSSSAPMGDYHGFTYGADFISIPEPSSPSGLHRYLQMSVTDDLAKFIINETQTFDFLGGDFYQVGADSNFEAMTITLTGYAPGGILVKSESFNFPVIPTPGDGFPTNLMHLDVLGFVGLQTLIIGSSIPGQDPGIGYYAVDNLLFSIVPEPTTGPLVGMAALLCLLGRRRR